MPDRERPGKTRRTKHTGQSTAGADSGGRRLKLPGPPKVHARREWNRDAVELCVVLPG